MISVLEAEIWAQFWLGPYFSPYWSSQLGNPGDRSLAGVHPGELSDLVGLVVGLRNPGPVAVDSRWEIAVSVFSLQKYLVREVQAAFAVQNKAGLKMATSDEPEN